MVMKLAKITILLKTKKRRTEKIFYLSLFVRLKAVEPAC